jgi:hypothetical protein
VVVVGRAAPAAALAARIAHQHPGAFDVIRAASQSAAHQAITGRRAYGVIVVGTKAPQVLTASAASPGAAQMLAQLADEMSG